MQLGNLKKAPAHPSGLVRVRVGEASDAVGAPRDPLPKPEA
jgi:hypothetical protein